MPSKANRTLPFTPSASEERQEPFLCFCVSPSPSSSWASSRLTGHAASMPGKVFGRTAPVPAYTMRVIQLISRALNDRLLDNMWSTRQDTCVSQLNFFALINYMSVQLKSNFTVEEGLMSKKKMNVISMSDLVHRRCTFRETLADIF